MSLPNLSPIKAQAQAAFQDLRFGMFIHFGLYSLGEEHEWHQYRHLMHHNKYRDQFMPRFNPDPKGIEQWVLTAKAMGAKYIVCTSKHHDGFCLWDTKIPHQPDPSYHIRSTPFWQQHQKSVIDFLFEAGRKHGIRIGLYYSVVDWSWTDGEKKWFKPAFHVNIKNTQLHDAYVSYFHQQVVELATLYPDLLCVWFDGYQFKHFPKHPHGFLEYLQSSKIYQKMNTDFPHVLIGNNSGHTTGDSDMGETDFLLFENAASRGERSGAPWPRKSTLPGEVCLTINRAWGYSKNDKNYKNPKEMSDLVIYNAERKANTLLNFGPMPNGYIAEDQAQIAHQIGEYLSDRDK
jgi:alpha-L-fucosidase